MPAKPPTKPAAKTPVTAALVVIGNEVLSGRTQDANIQFLAERLNALGIRLAEARVIADSEAVIVAAVNELRARHDYLFTTGGIGPTHDDITSASVAKAFGRPLVRNPEAEAILRAHYRPEDITEARLKMAEMPEDAVLIENPVSRAPGFQVENVFVLPGVPTIMQAMFGGLENRLVGGDPVISRAITVFIPEGEMAAPLGELQAAHQATEIGSYPFVRHGKIGTCLVIRATDAGLVERVADELRRIIRDRGGEPMEE